MILSKKYKTLLNKYYVNTPLRLAHFFAQLEAESRLKPVEENLNYSAKRLQQVFKKYFPTVELANKYGGNKVAIASRVYANRMGNGCEDSREGYLFRGRGFIQLTGRDNYVMLSKDTRINYLLNPDWLLREPDAMIAALWYWSKNNLNKHADADNIDAISDLINIGRITKTYGDSNGFKERLNALNKYKKEFGVK